MILYSFVLEVAVALAMLAVVIFWWRHGHREGLERERGWSQILAGFGLLLVGALVDISDHFPELGRLVVLGQTPAQSFLEKVVGFFGGFVLLAIGLRRWLPIIAERRRREQELRQDHVVLEERVRQDYAKLKKAHEELRRAKEAAEAASQAKSDFLASMSHELRTPLNSVIGFANVLAKNKENNLGPRQLRYVERIQDNGRHLLAVINEILDLSRIEAGRVELNPQRVDLCELVADTLAQTRNGADPSEDVVLEVDLPAVRVPIETDPVRLRQVILNLVSNAFKFTERGRVTVRLVTDPDDSTPRRLEVRDTGIGMPPERLATIFDAFRQLDTGTARSYDGAGLGLSISRSLCRLLGYELEVESVPSRGSTFSVHFPPAALAAGGTESAHSPISEVARPAEAGDLRHLAGKRILIVDDNADSRLLLMQFFEELGCRALAVGSGEEGLHLARQEHPDLIVLDLMMPRMNGWEVLADLKRDPALAAIPVVVVSIVAEEQRGTLLGAVEALTKPVDRNELLAVLDRCFRKPPAEALIVDDEEDQRLLLAGLLRQQGIRVRTATDGHEALAELEQGLPDVVLVDLVMPGMDGATLLRELRGDERYRQLPVVVVTGKELTSEEVDSLQRSAAAVVIKNGGLRRDLAGLVAEAVAEQTPWWTSKRTIEEA